MATLRVGLGLGAWLGGARAVVPVGLAWPRLEDGGGPGGETRDARAPLACVAIANEWPVTVDGGDGATCLFCTASTPA